MAFLTNAFSAQDALIAALQASTDLAGWRIDYGLPYPREEQHIWVDEQIDSWEQGADTTGIVGRDEGFRLHVYVYARKTGATALEIRDEVKGAADVVADIVASSPFLGGSVMYAQVVEPQYDGAFADNEGRKREGILRLTIGCAAYVSGA